MTSNTDINAISISNLCKSFGARTVLKNLDLTVSSGESLGLFGANGAGKTTLIRILATITRITSGEVTIQGMNLNRNGSNIRRAIGMVTHENLLYGDLTGYENLQFYARLYSLKDYKKQIHQLTERLKITNELNEKVRTLSHGTRKRFDIARALLHNPRILLLDEPETGLDSETFETLAELLDSHKSTGGSSIMTTHNVERGLSISDKVAIISRGRISYEARKDSLDSETFLKRYSDLAGDLN